MPKTAKRSTKPVTPTMGDERKAQAAVKKAKALIANYLPAKQAAEAKEKAEREAAEIAKNEKKLKAMQAENEKRNPLCGVMPGDTLSNCRQVLQFLRSTTYGMDGNDALESDEAMGLSLIYSITIDALRRQEQAL